MKMTKQGKKDEADASSLTSLEEMILRMRFGLGKEEGKGALERNVSDDLRKKLQFLELKAFEQSGRINELLKDLEKKPSGN
jgi:hypothetical protein